MERAFDIALTLHADHELNASTFAGARDRGDAIRHLLRRHFRHRRAERPAARRRQRRCDPVPAQVDAKTDAAVQEVRDMLTQEDEDCRASATASTTPKIRARRTCASCPRNSASAPATWICTSPPRKSRSSSRNQGSERERGLLLGLRPTTRSAFRSICTRRSSPSAACPAGPRTSSSSTQTIA